MRLIKHDRVFMLIGLFCFAGVSLSTLAQQPDLSQSPKGYRAFQEHRAALHELAEGYFKSLGVADDRFAKSSVAHIRRYTDGLHRAKTKQARAGNDSAVIFIEALIDLAASWTITAPDARGKHFLSDADLTVQGDDEATKLGTDLVARIDRLAPSYQRQADSVFARYEKDVRSAWKAYLKALEKARLEELKAGRHKAVIQVEDAIQALKNQGEIEVERPERGSGQQGNANDDEWGEGQVILKGDKIPDGLVGFYTFNYECADRDDHETIIELRKDGGLIRGEYYAPANLTKKAQWVQKPIAVEVSFQGDRKMKWQFKERSGRRIIVEIDYEVHSTGAVSTHGGSQWWYSNGPGEAEDCRVYKLGYRTDLHELFSEGDYIIDLDLILDPNKERIEGKMKFLLEYTSNTLFISKSTSRKNPGKFEPCQPTVFTLLEKEGQISFRAVDGLGWSRKEHFALRTLEDGTKEIRLWWNYRDYNAGHGPDASGTLTRQED